jgi:hypothetical protein
MGALPSYGGIAMVAKIMACPAFLCDRKHDWMLIAKLNQELQLCGDTCFQYTLYPSFTQVFPLFWQLPVFH